MTAIHRNIRLTIIAFAAGWLAAAAPAFATILTNNFDDGTVQGWSNVLTSPGDQPQFFEPSSNVNPPALAAQSGTYRIVPEVASFGGNEDSHHNTLVFRSPEFTLGSSGSISFYLGIGMGGAASPGPSFAALAAASVVPGSTGSGFMGMALRRVDTGAYVLSARRSADNTTTWEQFVFDTTTLTASNLLFTPLTLDLIDNFQGGHGWVSLDTVVLNDVVPEPSTALLFATGGAFLVWRRKNSLTR